MAEVQQQSLDALSPLASLISLVPQSTKLNLDFSSLDPATFAILNDACTHYLQQKSQDAELRVALSAKNRALESKVERLESDRNEAKGEADIAKRNEEVTRGQLAAVKAQLEASESSRRQSLQDLVKSRRELQTIKAASRQAKQANERSIARQRERFSDAATLAARNGCSRLVVVPGVFSSQGAAKGSQESLRQQHIADLESQRQVMLTNNSAMRRLCTESTNALSDLTSGLTGHGGARALQSDLFPPGVVLRKDFEVNAAAGSHPAVFSLATSIKAAERALFDWEKERRELKDKIKAKDEGPDSSDGDAASKVEGQSSVSGPATRKKAVRVPLPLSKAEKASEEAQQALTTELHGLRAKLSEREAELKKVESRLEDREMEAQEAKQRADSAERRELEAVSAAREEAARMVAEIEERLQKETDALANAQAAQAQAEAQAQSQAAAAHSDKAVAAEASFDKPRPQFVEGAAVGHEARGREVDFDRSSTSDLSLVLEPVGSSSKARRLTTKTRPNVPYSSRTPQMLPPSSGAETFDGDQSASLRRSRRHDSSASANENTAAPEKRKKMRLSQETELRQDAGPSSVSPSNAPSPDGQLEAEVETEGQERPQPQHPAPAEARTTIRKASSRHPRDEQKRERDALSPRLPPNTNAGPDAHSGPRSRIVSASAVKSNGKDAAAPAPAKTKPSLSASVSGVTSGKRGTPGTTATSSVLQAALERRRRAAAAAAAAGSGGGGGSGRR